MDEPIYHIHTERSWLTSYPIDDQMVKFIANIVSQIDTQLESNLPIMIYGKECVQHRSIGFFSNNSIGYKYSKKLVESKPLNDSLWVLLDWINWKFKSSYNGILINKYSNGSEYIGKHSDDESALSNAGVVSLSSGAIRTFRIRDKISGQIIKDVATLPNQILIMGGDFQKEFTHEIPIDKKVNEPRYSLTFRKHLI
jgi:alkylated DNA repair dioxygenase AlkB